MKIQKNISIAVKKESGELKDRAEAAEGLGVEHGASRELMAGKGSPKAGHIELLAEGLKLTPVQLVAGGAGAD